MDRFKRSDFDTLVFVNGVYDAEQSAQAVAGVTVALSEQQITLTVKAGYHCEKPLQLLQIVDTVDQATLKIVVNVQPQASIRIWLDNCSEETVAASVEQVIQLDIQAGAVCHWVTCQKEQGVQRKVQAHFKQAESSCFEWFYLGLESGRSEEDVMLQLQGQHTQSRLRGLLLPTAKQRMSVNSLLQHDQPHTHAEQVFRSIAADNGVARLQGRVLVQPGADKTYSTQSTKSMLLNPGAEVYSCPQLEIYADDVVCNHGASIGELDQTMLFYLQSRGIEKAQAQRLLLQGFAQAVVNEVSDGLLRAQLIADLEAVGRDS